jgi:putative ABC transport system permease protein
MELRARYADEMLRLMEDARTEAREQGQLALARFYVRAVRDALVNGIAERLQNYRRRDRPHRDEGAGMETWLQDLRYAVRTFTRRPALAVIGVLTLAIGIGGNTLIFSVVEAVLVRPLPFDDPGRVVVLSRQAPSEDGPVRRVAYSDPAFLALRDANRGLEALAAFSIFPIAAGGEDRPFQTTAMFATSDLWQVLGVGALLGRTFGPDDDDPGATSVALISHRIWASRYGGSPDVLSQSIAVGGRNRVIVGVLPPEFSFFNEQVDIWVPLAIDPTAFAPDAAVNNNRTLVARLPEGSDEVLADVLRETQRGAAVLRSDAFADEEVLSSMPIREFRVGSLEPTLLTLFGAVAFVLLIACANLANLLLIQAEGRREEFAVRSALGAGRSRIVRQLLTESVLLSGVGAALGIALAFIGLDVVKALAPTEIPRLDQAHLSGVVLAFTALLAVLTGVVFGAAPAVVTLRSSLRSTLSEGGRSDASGRARVRSALVIAEVAVTLVLMVGAGLLVNSLLRLRQIEPGFVPEGRLTAQLLLPPGRYGDNAQFQALFEEMVDRIEAIPSVVDGAYVFLLPMQMTSNWWVQIENREDEGVSFIDYNLVTPGYFETMGIPLVRGRLFDAAEVAGERPAIIVSETMAASLFPGENPLGRRLNVDMPPDQVWRDVVGVVGDVRVNSLSVEADRQMYFPPVGLPMASPAFGGTLVVRTDGDPMSLVASVRRAVAEVEPSAALGQPQALQDVVAGSEGERHFVMYLLMSFAGAALLLSVVGLYGVLSYSVTVRTREFGVRIALGASPDAVLRSVLAYGSALVAIGAVLGLGASVWLTRLLSGLLFEVRPLDGVTYVGVATVLVVVAVVTTGLPARRATRIDPAQALRIE